MSLVTWHPEESLNSFFVTDPFCYVTPSQWQKEAEALAPKVNITESESSFHLEAETPGMKDKDINIEVHNGVLTIKGHKVDNSEKDKETFPPLN